MRVADPAGTADLALTVLLVVVLLAATAAGSSSAGDVPGMPTPRAEMTGSSPSGWLESNPFIVGPPDSIGLGLPPVLRFEEGVKDPVFAMLIGLVSGDHYGTLTGDRIREELKRNTDRSRLPHQTVQEVTRLPVTPGRTAVVRVEFHQPLKLPIPFSILGYRPGSFSASRVCFFREWILGEITLEFQDDHRDPGTIWRTELSDVHLFGLVDGEIDIDIHGWLDFLMGSRLGDTRITGLMLGRHRGRWVGIAMGYSPENQGRSGTFDFEKDSISFPTPAELRPVGRRMRGRMEALMARWEYDNAPRAVIGGKMHLIEGLRHEDDDAGIDAGSNAGADSGSDAGSGIGSGSDAGSNEDH